MKQILRKLMAYSGYILSLFAFESLVSTFVIYIFYLEKGRYAFNCYNDLHLIAFGPYVLGAFYWKTLLFFIPVLLLYLLLTKGELTGFSNKKGVIYYLGVSVLCYLGLLFIYPPGVMVIRAQCFPVGEQYLILLVGVLFAPLIANQFETIRTLFVKRTEEEE